MNNRGIFYVLSIILILTVTTSCFDRNKYAPKPYERALELVKFSDNAYMHISYLKDGNGGYIPCNGYIYINNSEALIFDTAVNDSLSDQLIAFVEDELESTIKGVVVNHSHKDASGGLNAFHNRNIASYASQKTATILAKDSLIISHPFEVQQEIPVGNATVQNYYFGEAHTPDNIVSYIPATKTIVGGCMIKSLNAQKGNLKDANLDAWSETVSKIKQAYPETEAVIPGHGGAGDISLLDYTIDLFARVDGGEAIITNLE